MPTYANHKPSQVGDWIPDSASAAAREPDGELEPWASLAADIAVALSHARDLRNALQNCAEVIVRGLDAAFVRNWILNERTNVLELQASAGLYTNLDGPLSRVPLGHLKVGSIARDRKPIITNAVVGDPLVNYQEWARREGVIAFAGYPLVFSGRAGGHGPVRAPPAHPGVLVQRMFRPGSCGLQSASQARK